MIPVFGIGAINLLMLWSLDKPNFWRQVIFWIIGIFFFFVGKAIGPQGIKALKKKGYFFSLAFLVLPIILGVIIRGSARWILLAGFSLQPSELVKPILIGAIIYQMERIKINNFFQFLLLIAMAALPTILIVFQPDLGSAIIIFATLITIIFFYQPKKKWWFLLAFVALIILLLGKDKIFHPYQINRLKSFTNPAEDPLGTGYNLIQAQIAIGSGGLWGRGFGKGRQTQLAFLPEKHTDFIFAAAGEELGLIGIVFILGFYFWLFWKMIKKIAESESHFHYYFRMGIFILLFLQTSVNIAVNLQLLPVVGVPLPFLSYGGSSLITSLFLLGLFSM